MIQQALNCDDELDTFEKRKEFCQERHIAFLDLFQKIDRYADSSLDENIFPIVVVNLVECLKRAKAIKAVLFTSDWAMKIAKKEYLRVNQTLLKKLNEKEHKIIDEKGEEKVSYKYVTKKTFLIEENDKKIRHIKIEKIDSPSSSTKQALENKIKQWRDVFKKIGLLKK